MGVSGPDPDDDGEPLDAHAATMTAAEFRCLRESCGLTAAAVAGNTPHPVQVRTVQRWESGDLRVPSAVAEWLLHLDHELAIHAARLARRMAEERRPPVLIRARHKEDLVFWPALAPLGPTAQGALIDRARRAAAELGVRARIIYMDVAAYQGWLEERCLTHSADHLVDWASEAAARLMPCSPIGPTDDRTRRA